LTGGIVTGEAKSGAERQHAVNSVLTIIVTTTCACSVLLLPRVWLSNVQLSYCTV